MATRSEIITVVFDDEKITKDEILEGIDQIIAGYKSKMDRFELAWRDIGYGKIGEAVDKMGGGMTDSTANLYTHKLNKAGVLTRVGNGVYKHYSCAETPPSDYHHAQMDQIRRVWKSLGCGSIDECLRHSREVCDRSISGNIAPVTCRLHRRGYLVQTDTHTYLYVGP